MGPHSFRHPIRFCVRAGIQGNRSPGKTLACLCILLQVVSFLLSGCHFLFVGRFGTFCRSWTRRGASGEVRYDVCGWSFLLCPHILHALFCTRSNEDNIEQIPINAAPVLDDAVPSTQTQAFIHVLHVSRPALSFLSDMYLCTPSFLLPSTTIPPNTHLCPSIHFLVHIHRSHTHSFLLLRLGAWSCRT